MITMKSSSSSSSTTPHHVEDVDKFVDELPKANFMNDLEIYEWEGYWLSSRAIKAAVTFRTSFEARNDDVFLASSMKTGTTWLKSLLFCIMQRQNHQTLDTSTHDVLTMKTPHLLVPTVEAVAFTKNAEAVNAYDASSARLLHTHVPHALLPESVKNLGCKIIYVARNPKDTIISGWHFFNNSNMKQNQEPFPLEKYIDCFCAGMHPFGPYVEHVAEYWEESRKRPEKILFLKYEELKDDPKWQVMKIAEFLEKPFEDEEEGEVDEIVRRCSLERLKNLEVNKNESHFIIVPNSSFFRKGEVGDFKNYLTPEMEMKIHQTISLKLEALGLYL